MKHLFTLPLALGLLVGVQATAQQRCGAMENLQREITNDPQRAARLQQIENMTAHYLATHDRAERGGGMITIPVVFHVIYNTPEQNISDFQIQEFLNQINADLSRTSADSDQTPPEFLPLAATLNIQFCKAVRDPFGNVTTGITRTPTAVTGFDGSDVNKDPKFAAKGGHDPWPSDSYCNYWLCNLTGGADGYGSFPGGPAELDGIVQLSSEVGSIANPGPADYPHTAIHEVGHWLNIRHIWGDADCGDDFVDDTPTQFGSNLGLCPTVPHITCSNGPIGDMFCNFMDYTDEACINMFSLGQADRMYALFGPGGARESLLTSMGCVPVVGGCANNLMLDIQADGVSTTLWEVREQVSNSLVASGGATYPLGPHSEPICVPNGCYRLVVTDNAGDGITGGGYTLRTVSGNLRIIDNANNFTTGSSSSIATTYDNGAFCVPIGDNKPVFQHCDKLDWLNDHLVALVATTDPLVSASWNASAPPTDKGYEFWWFDPNGTYSYRRFRSHAASDGYSPASATRACKVKINGWSNTPTSPWLTVGKLYNVRIRARYGANSYSPFGPACLFKINPAAAACPLVKLQDNPANTTDYSCGVIRQFGGSNNAGINMNSSLPGSAANWGNKLVATPPQPTPAVASANVRYQFRFVNPGEVPAGTIVRPVQTSPTIYLNWTTGTKLKCGVNYNVSVRVSLDGGATWCVGGNVTNTTVLAAQSPVVYWGPVCTVSIAMNNNAPCPPTLAGGSSNLASESIGGTLTMYPNPNRGDQLFISLSEVAADVRTVSVDIYDMTGKKVTARTIAVQDGFLKTALDLQGNISSGMYLVNITAGDNTYTERLVIQP